MYWNHILLKLLSKKYSVGRFFNQNVKASTYLWGCFGYSCRLGVIYDSQAREAREGGLAGSLPCILLVAWGSYMTPSCTDMQFFIAIRIRAIVAKKNFWMWNIPYSSGSSNWEKWALLFFLKRYIKTKGYIRNYSVATLLCWYIKDSVGTFRTVLKCLSACLLTRTPRSWPILSPVCRSAHSSVVRYPPPHTHICTSIFCTEQGHTSLIYTNVEQGKIEQSINLACKIM